MSLYRRAAKRDDAEPAVVDELTRRGAKVTRLSGIGVPDLLVSFRGRWLLAEVKTGKAKARPTQDQFRRRHAPAPVATLRTPAEAVAWLLAEVPVVERVMDSDALKRRWVDEMGEET